MRKLIISDTSSLILFSKIGHFELLHELYKAIVTTPEVAKEFQEPLPEWIKIKSVSNKNYQELLETQLDKGEASAIALAVETVDCTLLLDDLKARKLAKKMNLEVTGALGVIQMAKNFQLIEFIKPILDKILQTNFHISQNIINEMLRINDEQDS